MSEKAAPAMFEGARVPKDPAPTAAAKPTDRAAALKSTGSGVPAGRLTGFALLPVIAVGLIALAAWSPMAALIAGAALLVMVLISMVGRSVGKRRVATRTSVRPDGTVTTTTQPVSRRERNRRQRTRGGPPWRRTRGGGGGSPSSRSRSWIPGSDRRSRQSAAHNGPGSPGGRKTPGGRPDGGNPGRPSARQRMRDRMWPNRKDRNAAGSSTGPGGRTAPSGPGKPHAPGSPNSRSQDNSKRWPWSRNRSSDGSPGGKTPGGSPNGRRPKNNAGSPGSPGGGGGPSGQPGGKKPRNVKHTAPSAPSAPSGGKPSKVPNWVKRAVAPASPPPQREWTGGAARRTKDKVRSKWSSAWSDNTPVVKPRQRTADDGDESKPRRRHWWPTRRSDSAGDSSTAAAPTGKPEGRYRRLMQRLNRPATVAPVDHAARLDEVWKSRGRGQRAAPKADPAVRPKPAASSAESGLMAEGWTPTPQPPTHSRHSAESGLRAEGDWAPSKPSRSAPRPASKGGSSTMSDNGSSESQVSAGTAKAYEAAQSDSRAASGIATNTANMLRRDAASLPNTPRMAPHKAALGVQAGRWARVSAVYDAISSKLSQSAARHQNGERLQ